jgi:hypothetical protein
MAGMQWGPVDYKQSSKGDVASFDPTIAVRHIRHLME